MKKNVGDLTEGAILSKMFRFALPLMATSLLQVLYNVADMITVGRFAENGSFAMGAVGACGPLINLMVVLFTGMAAGVGVCVAQNVGAGDRQRVREYVHTSALLALLCGMVLAVFGFFAAEPMLKLMDTPPTVLVEAVPYMKAYFVGMPAMLLYNFLAAALRSSGDTKRPLGFLLIAGLLNVVFNVVMVVGFGFGAVGVGAATTVSQIAAALLIVRYMSKMPGEMRFSLKELSLKKDKVLGIVRYGLPAGAQNVVFAISNVLIQAAVNRYDGGSGILVSGGSASTSLEDIVGACLIAFYYSAMTFVGQNVGARKYERLPKVIFTCLGATFVTSMVVSGLVFLARDPLLSLYVKESDVSTAVRAAAAEKLTIFLAFKFLGGFMDVGTGILGGMGKPNHALVMTILGACGIRLVWIYLVCPHVPDVRGLYIIYPITWCITSLALLLTARHYYKKMRGGTFIPRVG